MHFKWWQCIEDFGKTLFSAIRSCVSVEISCAAGLGGQGWKGKLGRKQDFNSVRMKLEIEMPGSAPNAGF